MQVWHSHVLTRSDIAEKHESQSVCAAGSETESSPRDDLLRVAFAGFPVSGLKIVSDTLSPTSVKDALKSSGPIPRILVQGWVRTRRDSKDFSFLELNDGSCLRNLQIIARSSLPNYADVQRLTTGASII